mmetsp:Transcript_36902/g.59700  ORF Transcript_36902/g.59700 Transcript_36902/m.59700 type:complete len:213 (-) Transcript_36902:94-732(-)
MILRERALPLSARKLHWLCREQSGQHDRLAERPRAPSVRSSFPNSDPQSSAVEAPFLHSPILTPLKEAVARGCTRFHCSAGPVVPVLTFGNHSDILLSPPRGCSAPSASGNSALPPSQSAPQFSYPSIWTPLALQQVAQLADDFPSTLLLVKFFLRYSGGSHLARDFVAAVPLAEQFPAFASSKQVPFQWVLSWLQHSLLFLPKHHTRISVF